MRLFHHKHTYLQFKISIQGHRTFLRRCLFYQTLKLFLGNLWNNNDARSNHLPRCTCSSFWARGMRSMSGFFVFFKNGWESRLLASGLNKRIYSSNQWRKGNDAKTKKTKVKQSKWGKQAEKNRISWKFVNFCLHLIFVDTFDICW